MQPVAFDVVVAGAGPSGCAAAIALQLAGVSVCLVDKESATGRKVGESLPGATIRLLKRLGIDGISELLSEKEYKNCYANISSWGNNDWFSQPGLKNPEGGGHHVDRTAFNRALRDKAVSMGIPFYNDMIEKADRIKGKTDDGFIIELKYSGQGITTKWIMDATGRKAAIARKFGLQRKRLDNQMAVVNWTSTTETDTDQATRIKSVPDGWWYTSLLPGKSRVIGFQSLPETVSVLHKNPQLFLEKFNEAELLSHTIKEEAILQSVATEAGLAKCELAAVNGLLCIGDAALSFDPLSSQGIFFALYSGIKGAETVMECLDDRNKIVQALKQYESIVDGIFAENKKSLRYFYMNEMRFLDQPYWQSKRAYL